MKIEISKIKLPYSLLIVLFIPMIFGNYISEFVKEFFFSVSISIKHALIFVLPFVIYSFVFSCLISMKSSVVRFVILLILCVFISNYTAIMTGYFVGSFFVNTIPFDATIMANSELALEPLWNFELPQIISNQNALILGFVSGLIFSIKRFSKIDLIAENLNKYANLFLKRILTPLIPLFILGFIFKLEHERLLSFVLKTYGPFFVVIIGLQISYVCAIYFVAGNFKIGKALFYLKNILPATITGFSTISSAASMPVLMLCSEKNTDPQMARTIIPASINIHTIGSAIGMTVLSLATMKMFDAEVSAAQFVNFAFFYALAKYSVAAVPGGFIIVALPLLEAYLGFTPDMLGIISAMYMMFDPFGTATNVTANGAFTIIFEKIYRNFNNHRKVKDIVSVIP